MLRSAFYDDASPTSKWRPFAKTAQGDRITKRASRPSPYRRIVRPFFETPSVRQRPRRTSRLATNLRDPGENVLAAPTQTLPLRAIASLQAHPCKGLGDLPTVTAHALPRGQLAPHPESPER